MPVTMAKCESGLCSIPASDYDQSWITSEGNLGRSQAFSHKSYLMIGLENCFGKCPYSHGIHGKY